jgi:glycosyltransferase involved in cell wall biosynthesis
MRIGLVVPGFSADAEDWCIPALRHLARAHSVSADVRVIAVRYPYRAQRYSVDGADVIAVGGATRRGLSTLGLWRTTIELIREEHRRRPFDVLHAFWATESGLLAAIAGRWLRVPTLVSLAGGELVNLPEIEYGDQRIAWERLKISATLRLASAVSAGSRGLQSLAEQYVARERLHRAPLGVDLGVFKPDTPRPAADRRLVHVATLTRVKDQATLLRAFLLLHQREPDVELDIVGDGPLRAELERLASKLGLGAAVRFRGAVDHARLPSVYRTGGTFVLSSRHEAQGMVAVEAAACGVPVVGTAVGVIPELVASVDAVVPVGSAAALADALTAACRESNGYGRVARERVADEFSLDTCAARFRALYAALGPP